MTIEQKFESLPSHTNRKPIVAIVGAGIAGLTLAVLLEQQGIEYNVYERAKDVKPLGSALVLGPAVIPLFKQIGIYDEFVSLSKVCNVMQIYTDKREPDHVLDFTLGLEMTGCDSYAISRPALYDLLLSRVPKHRVHMNKKVLTIVQSQKGVMIRTWDNHSHEADILIGADGAHSAVRQGLYAFLKEEGRLPPSDGTALPFSCVCLVGQTEPLDPERFPHLKLDHCQFINTRGETSPYSWGTFTSRQNTICWAVFQYLDEESSKTNDSFRNSEWGPEAAEAMCNEVRHLAIPGAAPGAPPLTLGDVFDQTRKDLISKVMLEEKLFKTWYSGRTVLIGDACHKINPAGGQGSLLAMHDAVCVANWISILNSTKVHDIENVFQKYQEERYPLAKESFESSKMFRSASGKNWVSKLTQYLTKNMPTWMWRIILASIYKQRPQVSFLPRVEDTGTVKPAHQASLYETQKIHKANASVAV